MTRVLAVADEVVAELWTDAVRAHKVDLVLTDPWEYTELSETVEAWGFRLMQDEGRCYGRAEVARRWYTDEYQPVVRMLREADLIGDRTEARGLPARVMRPVPPAAHPPLGRRGHRGAR